MNNRNDAFLVQKYWKNLEIDEETKDFTPLEQAKAKAINEPKNMRIYVGPARDRRILRMTVDQLAPDRKRNGALYSAWTKLKTMEEPICSRVGDIDNEGFAIFAVDKDGNDYSIIKATHREGEIFAKLTMEKQRMEQCFNMGGEEVQAKVIGPLEAHLAQGQEAFELRRRQNDAYYG